MKIKVDFYKESGKWYEGGIVEIPDGSWLHTEDIREFVMCKQNIVDNPEQFHCVVNNVNENDNFFKALWTREG